MMTYVGSVISYLMRDTVCSLRSILRSLHHGWQLQVLVVLIIAFLSAVPLPGSDDLLVELNHMVHSLIRR